MYSYSFIIIKKKKTERCYQKQILRVPATLLHTRTMKREIVDGGSRRQRPLAVNRTQQRRHTHLRHTFGYGYYNRSLVVDYHLSRSNS